MRIGIDVSPLETGHKFRGVGFYTQRLVKALKEIDKSNEYILNNQQSTINNQQFDLIHYPYFDLFFLTLPIRKPAPTVVTIHDVIPLIFHKNYPKGIKGWLKFQIQKFSLKSVKVVITDSQNSRKDIVKYLGFSEEKVFVIPLAPSEEFQQLTISKPALQDSSGMQQLARVQKKYFLPDRFVLYVGDVNWNKNIPRLVQACEKTKIPLVIVGKQAVEKNFDSSHPENQDLVWLQNKYQSAISNQQSAIILTGFVSTKDLVAIYNLASVYCQPSFYEGFCLPVLEAMACGTPVVCSRASSLPEVVGDAGILIDPDDCNSLVQGIKKVLEEKGLAEKLRIKSLSQARQFTWRKTAMETINVYEKVLAKQ